MQKARNRQVNSFAGDQRMRRTIMIESSRYLHKLSAIWRQTTVALAVCLLLCGGAVAQDPPAAAVKPDLSFPVPTAVQRVAFPLVPNLKPKDGAAPAKGTGEPAYYAESSSTLNRGDAQPGVQRITLEEAEQMAAGANNPLVRLGQLSVEVAKQHRLGVQALYYPNIGTQFANLHLNKETGQAISFSRLGVSVPVNIFSKNQTDFNVGAAQPVTPL